MKIIHLEVQDTVYQKIIDFLALLPEDQCHLLLDNDLSDAEKLENEELNKIADARLNDGQAFIRVSLNDL
ncbi:MAG: hypothetical protein M0Q44_09160 [Methylobacter sp.]|jgi:hypothetical protein|nr:hypothetical protein [Methylobacter sp.]